METKRELFIRKVKNFISVRKFKFDEVLVIGDAALEIMDIRAKDCRQVSVHISNDRFLRLERRIHTDGELKGKKFFPRGYFGKRMFLICDGIYVFSIDEISQNLSKDDIDDIDVTDGICHLTITGLLKFDLEFICEKRREEVKGKKSTLKPMNGIRKWK